MSRVQKSGKKKTRPTHPQNQDTDTARSDGESRIHTPKTARHLDKVLRLRRHRLGGQEVRHALARVAVVGPFGAVRVGRVGLPFFYYLDGNDG